VKTVKNIRAQSPLGPEERTSSNNPNNNMKIIEPIGFPTRGQRNTAIRGKNKKLA
jgi:hypothetical protein